MEVLCRTSAPKADVELMLCLVLDSVQQKIRQQEQRTAGDGTNMSDKLSSNRCHLQTSDVPLSTHQLLPCIPLGYVPVVPTENIAGCLLLVRVFSSLLLKKLSIPDIRCWKSSLQFAQTAITTVLGAELHPTR